MVSHERGEMLSLTKTDTTTNRHKASPNYNCPASAGSVLFYRTCACSAGTITGNGLMVISWNASILYLSSSHQLLISSSYGYFKAAAGIMGLSTMNCYRLGGCYPYKKTSVGRAVLSVHSASRRLSCAPRGHTPNCCSSIERT